MVFIFASNFEFSAASTSTYCVLWSAGVLDAAGLSTAIGASDIVGLFGAIEALDVLGLPSVGGGAVLLRQSRRSPALCIDWHCSVVCALTTSEDMQSKIASAVARIFVPLIKIQPNPTILRFRIGEFYGLPTVTAIATGRLNTGPYWTGKDAGKEPQKTQQNRAKRY
jgi:hypothetical protein